MRVLTIVLTCVSACGAQSEEGSVAATLAELERAEQAGDFNAWVSLWSSKTSTDAEKMRPYVRPVPAQRYHAFKIFVQGDEAAVLAQAVVGNFVNLTLRKESGRWKIDEYALRDSAPDTDSVYALAPPESGSFLHAGSPWDQIAPGVEASQAARLGWQMRVVFDESYLYIRMESNQELPAQGSTIEKPPGGWPVLKIDASSGEFVLYDAVNVGDQATFDENGRANSHRHFAAYSMRLERNGHEVFSAPAGLHPERLIQVSGRYFEMRIPLRTLGLVNSRGTKITIGDAQWPKSLLVSADVQRYPR